MVQAVASSIPIFVAYTCKIELIWNSIERGTNGLVVSWYQYETWIAGSGCGGKIVGWLGFRAYVNRAAFLNDAKIKRVLAIVISKLLQGLQCSL